MDNYAERKLQANNEDGVKIEPFSLKDEIRGGIMTKDGVYRLKRERDGSIDLQEDDEGYENDDPWLNSIKD